MKWVACFLWFLTLAAGCVLEEKPLGDGGTGGTGGDCGTCEVEKPICNQGTCVECTLDDQDLCMDSTPLCHPIDFECVGCVGDSDCTAIDAAKCDLQTKQCGLCDIGDVDQCSNAEGLPDDNSACGADGVCVDCTPATEEETCPLDKTCNPRTFECTGVEAGTLDTCQACVADSECGVDGAPSEAHRCVPMFYPNMATRFPNAQTGFCLKSIDLGGSCTNPYRIVITRASLSGAAVDDYCGINEELASCPAVRALLADAECDPVNGDQDCPQPAGLCRELPGMLNRCTYFCGSGVECMSPPAPGSTCGSSGGGGDNYCGG